MSEKRNPSDREGGHSLSSLYVSQQRYSIDEASFIPIDIHETKEAFVIEVEVAGIHIEDIKISLVDSDVVIEGTKHEKIECEGKVNFLLMERSFGPFRRTVKIDHAVDKVKLKAQYTNGVLRIWLPKKSERRSRIHTIPIEKEEK